MRTRRRRGQALVEMAMLVPLLALLMLGAADLGRAFHRNVSLAGAGRIGMRVGTIDTATDIGAAIRGEPAIANDVATWGATGPGGVNAVNGDPNGCVPSSFVGSQVACFAVQACTLSGTACTASPPNWGSRPAPGSAQGLQVHAVYKFTFLTPIIGAFFPGGVVYLTADTYGIEQY